MTLANIRSFRLLATALALLALAGCAAVARVAYPLNEDAGRVKAGTYTLDPDHTSLIFAVDHLGFSTFYGRFNVVTGSLNLDRDHPENSDVSIVINTASVDTHVPALDDKLRGADMFDTVHHRAARFTSTKVIPTGNGSATIEGVLSLMGKTAPVTLSAHFHGSGRLPLVGDERVGFDATGSFKRSAFGLTTWTPLVSDEVKLTISVEFKR